MWEIACVCKDFLLKWIFAELLRITCCLAAGTTGTAMNMQVCVMDDSEGTGANTFCGVLRSL